MALAMACTAMLFAQGGGRLIHNEAERLAKWKPVPMEFRAGPLSSGERRMIEKLVDACRLINSVYWRQSDIGGLAIYQATKNPTIKGLFSIMGSRWDLIDENRPFL
ncbi:MAG: hypothetical protein M3Z36_01220, partial [Acidobacteriota bacterium]|nr:hypothetical protein [Acidobacteriota bacterium]